MQSVHLPLPLVQWTVSFLTDHQAAVCLDNHMSRMAPVENGIPQGSPILPALSILYFSEELALFEAQSDLGV